LRGRADSIGGSANTLRDVPILVALAERGELNLGALVSRRITLDEINVGLEAIGGGEVIRSVMPVDRRSTVSARRSTRPSP
jgi:Zn-dependent alcohol dehydrogenase